MYGIRNGEESIMFLCMGNVHYFNYMDTLCVLPYILLYKLTQRQYFRYIKIAFSNAAILNQSF